MTERNFFLDVKDLRGEHDVLDTRLRCSFDKGTGRSTSGRLSVGRKRPELVGTEGHKGLHSSVVYRTERGDNEGKGFLRQSRRMGG